MAEIASASSSIAASILSLSQALIDYAEFLQGVEGQITRLRSMLNSMNAFLQDAGGLLETNNVIKIWVSDVRNLAHESEDLIDKYLLTIGKKPPKVGCFSCVSDCYITASKLPIVHTLGQDIEKIMVKVGEAAEDAERFNLRRLSVAPLSTNNSQEAESFREFRRTTSYADDENIIGLSETISQIKEKITSQNSSRCVVSIVGTGGLGKTTLARKLYNVLKPDFALLAWVCVSEEYKPRDVLSELIKSVARKTDADLACMTTIPSLEKCLRDSLAGNRYLVVMDDVWKTGVWDSLRRAFPDDKNGSRLIITTRNGEVAAAPNSNVYVHELRFLNEDESWELFCKKAFSINGLSSSPHLENLGREMVKKCAGLPLAIVALAGVLSRKVHKINGWEEVRDNLWKELRKGSIPTDVVLALSFDDLPYHLKPCFLYVGMFPEDFEIDVTELMRLWVAEGFVREVEGRPEDVAEAYYSELVERSLIQRTTPYWFTNARCRVHDLIRDMAIRKAEDIRLFRYRDDGEETLMEMTRMPHRRLAAYESSHWKLPTDYSNHSLRTLVWRVEKDLQLKTLHQRFSLLRVLAINFFSDMLLLPKEIGRLIHLRYLDLSKSSIGGLPETIGELKAIQTLRTSRLHIIHLPNAMEKLQRLRHLEGKFLDCSALTHAKSLQTLDSVTAEAWSDMDAAELSNLRRLGITRIRKTLDLNSSRFYDNLDHLKNLQYLGLSTHNGIADIDLCEIMKHCSNISHLKLTEDNPNDLTRRPDWTEELCLYTNKLQTISLAIYWPGYDPMHLFKRLPSLKALEMTLSDGGSGGGFYKLCSDEGGDYPQLQTLIIVSKCRGDISLEAADGAMPLLKHLEFEGRGKISWSILSSAELQVQPASGIGDASSWMSSTKCLSNLNDDKVLIL